MPRSDALCQETQPALRRELGLWDLVLLNISAVVGVRWLSAAAHSGPGAFLLQALAAVFFFIPCALAVSGLSRRVPEEGGLYVWAREAFGKWHGFLCAWFYLLSNIVFFPTVLLAGVSMASYLFGPAAVKAFERPEITIPVTLAALWLTFLCNLLGLNIGKWTANLGGAASYLIVVVLFLLAVTIASKDGLATRFHLLPDVSFDSVNLWSQIAFSFIGLELGAILGGEIKNPVSVVPRAAGISAVACVLFYFSGTFALLALLPPEKISVLTGLAQGGQAAGDRLGLPWLSPAFALLISIGIMGQVGAYIAGISRLPYAIGLDRHMPPVFSRLHPRWKTPYVSLLSQGIAASVFLIALQTGESVAAAYQVLVDMCTLTGFLPFLYIFGSAFRFGHRIAGASGFAVSSAAILLSLSPPAGIASVWAFELKLIGGCAALTWLGWLIFARNRNSATVRAL